MPDFTYMTPAEVERSAQLGNRIATEIKRRNGPPLCHSAIRHTLAQSGIHDAKALAVQLLGCSFAEAGEVVRKIQSTRATDIISPHWTL